MANKGLEGIYFIPDHIKKQLQDYINSGKSSKNRRRIIGYLNDGYLTYREIAKLLYDYKQNNLGNDEELEAIEPLIKYFQREISDKAEHIYRTKKSQSNIGIENKHKKTHFKWGDDTKPIRFHNLISVPKPTTIKMFEGLSNKEEIQRLIAQEQNQHELNNNLLDTVSSDNSKLKTIKELKKILTLANPYGFIVVEDSVDNMKGYFVTIPSNLDISNYTYFNLESDKKLTNNRVTKVVSLLLSDPIGFDNIVKGKNGEKINKKTAKLVKLIKNIFSISDFINLLNNFSDDSLIILSNGETVDDIRLNENQTIYTYNVYGGPIYFESKPNDIVILTPSK